jgi:predicted DNA-binding transcriptional regulator AlpA
MTATATATEIVGIEWVSQRTGVPIGTLRHYRLNGTGPKSFKLGRRVMYAVEDVEAWIEAARNA